MNNGSRKAPGKSRLAPPALRQDALASQARSQQAKTLLSPIPQGGRARANSEPTPKPPTGAQRRAAKRAETAATKIQGAFRAFQARKAARADLQASIKGDIPDRLAKLVGQSYVDAGLLQATKTPIGKASGRLAGDWSGGVATQKEKLNDLRTAKNKIGTTHHTVSDHFLGFVHAGVKRLEAGSSAEKASALKFRSQVAKDTLYAGSASEHEKALFQVRQNLTYGPISDHIKGDPGIGFDATFSPTKTPGLKRDWDQRSTKVRPVHNVGLLLKSGQFELTAKGADHLATRLESTRKQHDADLHGVTYDVPVTTVGKGAVKTTVIEKRPQTIPVHDESSGHFAPVRIAQKKATVDGFEKRKWK